MTTSLQSWRESAAKQAILDFVAAVSDESGPNYVPPAERVAVFDNDGTLWCEKPMQVQVDFILRRLVEMADAEPALRRQQPWQAAHTKDMAWFGAAIDKHYQGDDSQAMVLLGGILKAFGAMSVDAFAELAQAFFHQAQHPSFGVSYLDVTFVPMVELLRYLEAHGFTCYIVSGGGRDFIRPVTEAIYGIPPERVVGSAVKLDFHLDEQGATVVRQPGLEFINDGPAKVVYIWDRIGRRPILAAGNSNGDIAMLQYTASSTQPSLCLLVNHDDAGREFSYTAGAEEALKLAAENGWTLVSVQQDWRLVFAFKGK